ncbi:hypothetical protein DPMN_188735 [Dreissena polymorpha]|uniref:Uncharacterized protein n=1 Tax=Dreissena polymorpha TaxID=45954 RepID=A0A9D4I8T5_DREPO|nr:hypothetical protein DPMN_188735 [Dreissena polymorpha]
MHNPESLSSDMVDLIRVLTRFRVLNDRSTVQVVAGRAVYRTSGGGQGGLPYKWWRAGRSTVQVVAGRVSNMIISSSTAGNKSVFLTKSTQSYSFCLMVNFLLMSYHDHASCSKLSI